MNSSPSPISPLARMRRSTSQSLIAKRACGPGLSPLATVTSPSGAMKVSVPVSIRAIEARHLAAMYDAGIRLMAPLGADYSRLATSQTAILYGPTQRPDQATDGLFVSQGQL